MRHIVGIGLAWALAACGAADSSGEPEADGAGGTESPDAAGTVGTGGSRVDAGSGTGGAVGSGGKAGTGGGVGTGGAAGAGGTTVVADAGPGVVKIGLITDVHYGQTTWGQKSPGYITDAIAKMSPWGPDVLGSLGDTVDGTWDAALLKTYLDDFSTRYAIARTPRALVPGNHDISATSLATLLADWPADAAAHFVPAAMFGSFDVRGIVHLVMLDAEYQDGVEPGVHKSGSGTSAPGYVPGLELTWLASDLAATPLPTIVLSHQCLGSSDASHKITNALAVEAVLEASHKVVAAFSGHAHQSSHAVVNTIQYFTLTSISCQDRSGGYTAHDKGTHVEVTLDTGARTLEVETYEDDSVKGYVAAHTDTASY
jgi:hypothetical protein